MVDEDKKINKKLAMTEEERMKHERTTKADARNRNLARMINCKNVIKRKAEAVSTNLSLVQ